LSSNDNIPGGPYMRSLSFINDDVVRQSISKNYGLSVRLIKLEP
jgi:hypothetical protein